MNISSVLTILLILFVIRFTGLIVCFPANFESLWRSGNQSEFPVSISVTLLSLIAIYMFYLFYKQIRNCDNKIKISYFIYFALIYSFLVFSSRDVYNTFSYHYFIQAFNVKLLDLYPNIELDLFYEKPFAFWGFLFMIINFIVFYKLSKLEIAIIMWIIPFCFINYMKLGDISFVYILNLLIITILGIKFSTNKSDNKILSPFILYCCQFFIILAIVIYVASIPSRAYSLKYFLQLLTIFYIPGFLLIYICNKSKITQAKITCWIIPSITGFSMMLPMLRLPTSYCFLHTLSFVNTCIFSGNIAIVVGLIVLISIFARIISKSLEKTVFYLLSIFAVCFYLLDVILYSYSQFRLNYHTLRWTSTMNDIWASTMKTCLTYVSTSTLVCVIVFVCILFVIAIKGRTVFKNCHNIRFSFLMLILSAQISSLFMLMSDVLPFILRDSFVELLKSLPNPILSEKVLSMEDIKTGFKDCGINLIEYKEKETRKNINTNLVLITLESVHWKYINLLNNNELKTFPKLSELKNRMEIFPFFFSNYPESSSADFTVVSGLQSPSHIYIENKSFFNYSNIASELKKLGYSNYMFCSGSIVDGNRISIVKSMPFDYLFYFETGNIKKGLESWSWGYKEKSTIDEILLKLKEQKGDRPYFLWYRMVCPHAPFDNFEGTFDYLFKSDDNTKDNTVVDYKNSLLSIDKEISRLIKSVDELNEQSKQKTIFALIADHGEMLGEKENMGLKGHGPYASPELTAIPFIIISQDYDELKINKNFGSQVDILPTLLDKLNIEPSTKHFGFGQSLISDMVSRPIYLSSIHSMALVEKGFYFDFRDKKSSNVIISKISLSPDSKPIFEPINQWSPQDIQEKYNRTKKFFELNKQLMENY